ncbi:hypothetical protein BR63_14470 [Thermanaerosceptrum fracticalcis]|uniref:Uncharacterized protein n=1 Tax=Thermanaerosceptrum fracticalcis TaxID=1712410 RepID=A0A7G6E5N3_THEFR|nr:hypothetical protein [Thermanaerosceptrum fracticalcis]QNB47387.1 hypothetical protein BR63_14470 [Thermanaerosceptrum fracticalcis]
MKRKFVPLLLMVFLTLSLVGNVSFAQANLKLEQSEPLTSSTGTLINYVDGTITQAGPELVALSADTSCSTTVSSITQTMYLQKKSGTSWSTVNSFQKTVYSTDYISDFRTASVSTGYTYRLLIVSKATSGVNDTREAYSDPITIQ